MSIYEVSINSPKKQLEFYKDLSEQLQHENQQLKEKIEHLENDLSCLKDEIEWYKQQCDDLEMQIGCQE